MRIQILELPAVVKGEDVQTPFALIFDECNANVHAATQQERGERMANLTNAVGASGFFATSETVTVVDRFQDVQVATEPTEDRRPVEIHYFGDPEEVAAAVARNHTNYFSD